MTTIDPNVQESNNALSFKRITANHTLVITGDLHIERDGDQISYGLKDSSFWNIHQQKFIALNEDPDYFMVTASNFYEAKAEFWARFRIYTNNRFGGYVKTEIRKIYSDRPTN